MKTVWLNYNFIWNTMAEFQRILRRFLPLSLSSIVLYDIIMFVHDPFFSHIPMWYGSIHSLGRMFTCSHNIIYQFEMERQWQWVWTFFCTFHYYTNQQSYTIHNNYVYWFLYGIHSLQNVLVSCKMIYHLPLPHVRHKSRRCCCVHTYRKQSPNGLCMKEHMNKKYQTVCNIPFMVYTPPRSWNPKFEMYTLTHRKNVSKTPWLWSLFESMKEKAIGKTSEYKKNPYKCETNKLQRFIWIDWHWHTINIVHMNVVCVYVFSELTDWVEAIKCVRNMAKCWTKVFRFEDINKPLDNCVFVDVCFASQPKIERSQSIKLH